MHLAYLLLQVLYLLLISQLLVNCRMVQVYGLLLQMMLMMMCYSTLYLMKLICMQFEYSSTFLALNIVKEQVGTQNSYLCLGYPTIYR